MRGFGLTADELAFLGSRVGKPDTVWEWGTGESTFYLAYRCRRVISVEHQPPRAAEAVLRAANAGLTNVSILSIPPNLPYVEGTIDDGDLSTFRSYVESYVGRGIDAVVIDGRARIDCARFVVERAPFGPDPLTRFFLHDCERPQYAPIFEMLQEDSRVGRLALLRPRQP